MKLRRLTRADVMARAHEITAPTFADALKSAWAETYEIEEDYAGRVAAVLEATRNHKKKYRGRGELLNYVSTVTAFNGFAKDWEKIHTNLFAFDLGRERLEVNTFDHGKFVSIFSVKVFGK